MTKSRTFELPVAAFALHSPCDIRDRLNSEKTMVNTQSESQHMAFFLLFTAKRHTSVCRRLLMNETICSYLHLNKICTMQIKCQESSLLLCFVHNFGQHTYIALTPSHTVRSRCFSVLENKDAVTSGGHLSGRPYLMTRESERVLQRAGEVTSFVIWVKEVRVKRWVSKQPDLHFPTSWHTGALT